MSIIICCQCFGGGLLATMELLLGLITGPHSSQLQKCIFFFPMKSLHSQSWAKGADGVKYWLSFLKHLKQGLGKQLRRHTVDTGHWHWQYSMLASHIKISHPLCKKNTGWFRGHTSSSVRIFWWNVLINELLLNLFLCACFCPLWCCIVLS